MNAQKARVAVEDMALHYRTLTEAKEDCKQQVAARMELLVAESETPITKEDKINLKRAAKALAAESTDKVKADAEELATLMNEIGL
jgi:hemerythrin-like domain-containing protein